MYLPSIMMPLRSRRLRCALRSYPYFVTEASSRIFLKSSAVPSATMQSFPDMAAAVTLLTVVNIPGCSPSVMTAHSPDLIAALTTAEASLSLKVSFFSSFGAVGWTLPRNFLSEPNSYFSKRSATSGVYSFSTAMSLLSTGMSMSVFMVTRSWLMLICPSALTNASLCFGVSWSRWA